MLEEKRNQIDEIDNQIIDLLDKRFNLTNQIGIYKKQNNINVLDQNRETLIIDKIKNLNLNDEEQIINIYNFIMEQSKSKQKILIKEEK